MNEPAPPRSGGLVFGIVLRLLYLVMAVTVIGLAADGFGYYRTPLAERPHQEAYRDLRPAGFRGHTLGVAGSAMLLVLLLYSARKRSRRLARFGPVSRWLSVHIYLGIFGPLLITLHTSFRISGLVAVSYWSMVAVALSGVFGRYLYRQIPRNLLGEERSPRELAEELARLERELAAAFPFADEAVRRLKSRASIAGAAREAARDRGLGPAEARRFEALLRERILLERRLERLARVQGLFHWWHVFHKPVAYVMLIIMMIHVTVSIATGYTWIF